MLDRGRVTPAREVTVVVLPVAAAVVIYGGAIVVQTAAGYAKPGLAEAGLRIVGRAEQTIDNSDGADGDVSVPVRRIGTFQWRNSSGADRVTLAELGKTCWVVDDETVAKTDGSGTRSPAGLVAGVEDHGVWVDVRGSSTGVGSAPQAGIGGRPRIALSRTDNPLTGLAATLDLPDPGEGLEWVHLDFRGQFFYGDADSIDPGDSSFRGHFFGQWIKDPAGTMASWAWLLENRSYWYFNHQSTPGATWTVGILQRGNGGAGLHSLEYAPATRRLSLAQVTESTDAPNIESLLVQGVAA